MSVPEMLLTGVLAQGCGFQPMCLVGLAHADLTAKLVGLAILGVGLVALLWDVLRHASE